MALKDETTVSHQRIGTNGMKTLTSQHGWVDFGLESKNVFPVWPTLRLGIKKCIWDANPRSTPLCGWGGVSGISITHVETFFSLIPPEDPGTACGKP